MHKVFISYHHANDQWYKDNLVSMGKYQKIFIDQSVDTGDISDNLSDPAIREKIRDEYLRDSTVTIVLVGQETKRRKHVDWEVYSSMIDGKINKKSGISPLTYPPPVAATTQPATVLKRKQSILNAKTGYPLTAGQSTNAVILKCPKGLLTTC